MKIYVLVILCLFVVMGIAILGDAISNYDKEDRIPVIVLIGLIITGIIAIVFQAMTLVS